MSECEEPGKIFKIDVLCLPELPRNSISIFHNVPVRAWCGNWSLYFHLLESNILHGAKTLVLLPWPLITHSDFMAPIQDSMGHFPGVWWLLFSVHKNSRRRDAQLCTLETENPTKGWKITSGTSLNCGPPGQADTILRRLARKYRSTPVKRPFWKRFRQAQHKIARFVDDESNDTTCKTAFRQSLSVLNTSVQRFLINYTNWTATLIDRRIEAVDAYMVYDLPRSRNLYYTGTIEISHAILYVKKKFQWCVDVTSWKAGLATLSTTAACAWMVVAFFSLLSWSIGRNHFKDIPRVCYALLASMVSFPALLPHPFIIRQSGRLLLAFWLLSMMFLSNYIQALLTTSVSAGLRLGSDDTPEKLSPKLKSQELRVCADLGSYASTLLDGGPGESEFVRDMRMALDMSSSGPYSSHEEKSKMCLDKVNKGTHVFLTQSDVDCSPSVNEKYTVAKENFGMRIVTYPVSKTSPFQVEFEYLTSRIFETGWRHLACVPYHSSKICYPTRKSFSARIMLVPQQLFSLYMYCIFIACAVLLLELLASRTYATLSCLYFGTMVGCFAKKQRRADAVTTPQSVSSCPYSCPTRHTWR
ncbi:hypothetical protein HPB48_016054 [Haemaphysalis longicornis]|uniref:Ionotropic receptor n=1 Tax=Haemaphysalis longicornis TaxID=44386 RepID=A0A9J6GNX8_HAELO|nr:hypothetical protein HPB48_016054 [Haemaphysalis longicornis]